MKTLTIVIPLYNEGQRLEHTLEILKKGINIPGFSLEQLIFIDDGSTDNTCPQLIKFKEKVKSSFKAKINIITYKANRGRGYAIRFAVLISKSDYVLYADADLSIPLGNMERFLPFLGDNDLMFGSKKKWGAKAVIPRSFLRKIVGYGHSLIASTVLGVFAWDFQGGFKLFSRRLIREVFPLLTIDRWGFDMEVIYLSKKLGYSTREIPVVWAHEENGSKVKLLRDILRSLADMFIIKYLWVMGKYSASSVSPAAKAAYSVY